MNSFQIEIIELFLTKQMTDPIQLKGLIIKTILVKFFDFLDNNANSQQGGINVIKNNLYFNYQMKINQFYKNLCHEGFMI